MKWRVRAWRYARTRKRIYRLQRCTGLVDGRESWDTVRKFRHRAEAVAFLETMRLGSWKTS